MCVEMVERVRLESYEPLGGECARVGRVIEQGIGGDFHVVEMDARAVGFPADRRGVASEMNIVAAGGKLDAKLGGDDAGAAVGGVAGDADAHSFSCQFSVFSSQ